MADVYLDKCLDDIEGGAKYIDQLQQSGYDINFVWKEKKFAYADELTAEAQRLHNNGLPAGTVLNIVFSLKKSHERKKEKSIIILDECLKCIDEAKNDEWINEIYNNPDLFGGFSYDSAKDNGIGDIYIKAAYDCRNKGMSFPEMLDNLKGIRINISSPVTKEDKIDKYANAPDTEQQTPEPEAKNSPIKSTIFFWICVFIGPMLVSLASYLSYALVGLADGLIFNLTMLLVAVIAQAISCYFGYSIAFHYSPKSNVPMVNGIICIIMLAIVSYNSLLYASYVEVISFVLGIITLIFCIMQKDKMTDIIAK